MLLKGKNTVIYRGGGTVSGAVARACAREGDAVFLAGRSRESLEAVAADVTVAAERVPAELRWRRG